MKNAKPLFFILAIVLIIWPVNYFIHGLQRPDPHAEKLGQIVQSNEFLMGLQNKSGEGCIALKHVGDVDVIIFGSSRAYASIDPYSLKKTLIDKSVMICAIPAWNTDFLHEFTQFLSKENLSPERLVWIVDSAVPLTIAQHDKRFEFAQSILSDPATQKRYSDKWIANIDTGQPVLGLSETDYAKRLEQHQAKLADLPLEQVKQRLEAYEIVRDGNIASVLKTAKINPLNAKNLRRFCTDLKLHDMRLDIIASPVPDMTKTLIGQDRPESGHTDLPGFFRANVPCAQSITARPLYDWGLDERHFINRFLKDDFNYDIWEDPDNFGAFFDAWPRRSKAHFYSPDHMNPVGAAIFSEQVGHVIAGE